MKMYSACLVLSLVLAGSNARADIESDIAAGVDIHKVIRNATEQGIQFGSIIDTIADIDPGLISAVIPTLVKSNPELAGEITVAAINAAPQYAKPIVDAAIEQAPSQSGRIISGIIEAGHDPLTFTPANKNGNPQNSSQAGNKQKNVPILPVVGGRGVTVGNGGGGGIAIGSGGSGSGSNTASPN